MSETYEVKNGKLKTTVPRDPVVHEATLEELESSLANAQARLASTTAKIQKEIDVYTDRIAAARAGGLKTASEMKVKPK